MKDGRGKILQVHGDAVFVMLPVFHRHECCGGLAWKRIGSRFKLFFFIGQRLCIATLFFFFLFVQVTMPLAMRCRFSFIHAAFIGYIAFVQVISGIVYKKAERLYENNG